MIYLGYFCFFTKYKNDDEAYGTFSCVAEAGNVKTALEKFKMLILDLKSQGDFFSDVDKVYLDSCVEVESIPENGFLSYYMTCWYKNFRGTVSTFVCGAKPEECRAYCYDEPEGDEEDEAVPFLVFD